MVRLGNRPGILPFTLFFLTVFSRLPFTSKFLYHMDSGHFALALDKYDVTLHQPHPPGYFLYVMLGRAIFAIVNDPNIAYVAISILFSGLTVIVVYYLADSLYNRKTAVMAAVFAMVSPNLWFHGEVALNYTVEAFFSAIIAYLCLKIQEGGRRYLWLSAIALAAAGGFRQNTMVFLLPLWLYSLRAVPRAKAIAAVFLLAVSCVSWFVPMIWMTGGFDAYARAFMELWTYNTGHNSVFENGWPALLFDGEYLMYYTVYDVGAGLFFMALAGYTFLRRRKFGFTDKSGWYFISIWILPSVLFYLLVVISTANPGYALIIMPALVIMVARSILYLRNTVAESFPYNCKVVSLFVVVFNVSVVFFSDCPVAYHRIPLMIRIWRIL